MEKSLISLIFFRFFFNGMMKNKNLKKERWAAKKERKEKPVNPNLENHLTYIGESF